MTKTSSTHGVVCPHCDYLHEGVEAWRVLGDAGERKKCEFCGGCFVCWAEQDVTYYARDLEGGKMLKDALERAKT